MTFLRSRPQSSLAGVLSASLLASLAACTTTTGMEMLPDGGPSQTNCKDTYPASQSVSQPCCPEWGADACGANLFCAAFDGREQPTCYVERSRLDMSECSADVQCASNDCNTSEKACRSMPSAQCTAAIGCANGPNDKPFKCVDQNGTATCMPDTDGSIGSDCTGDGDCQVGTCIGGRCGIDGHTLARPSQVGLLPGLLPALGGSLYAPS